MWRSKISAWRVGIAAALGLSLVSVSIAGGCTALPEEGKPQSFDLSHPAVQPLDQSGFGPQQDSSPQQLINDFILASSAGSFDDYKTVREYLMPETSTHWWANESVLIYSAEGAPHVSEVVVAGDHAEITVQMQAIGSVNEEGMLVATEPTSAEATFQLGRNADNQWRISELNSGVILSQAAFLNSYQPVNLFFLTVDQESLVPDPRWFPRKRLPSHLVQGLLNGPAPALAPAVYSTFHDSLVLPTRGVEVEGAVVQVHLVGDMSQGERPREKMSWQLTATLGQVKDVTAVETFVNSVELPQTPEPFGPEYRLGTAVGISDGEIVVGDGVTWQVGVGADEAGIDPILPCLGPTEGSPIAWISGPGQLNIRDGEGKNHSVQLGEITAPTVDRWGWVWTSRVGSRAITVVGAGKDPHEMEIPSDVIGPGDAAGNVTKVIVSPDGVRLLLLTSDGSTSRVWQGMIARDTQGVPVAVVNFEPVEGAKGALLDAAWAGAGNIMVLGRIDEGTEVTTIALGGFISTMRGPDAALEIVAGSQPNQLYLEGSDGQVYSRSGSIWRASDTIVKDVCFP